MNRHLVARLLSGALLLALVACSSAQAPRAVVIPLRDEAAASDVDSFSRNLEADERVDGVVLTCFDRLPNEGEPAPPGLDDGDPWYDQQLEVTFVPGLSERDFGVWLRTVEQDPLFGRLVKPSENAQWWEAR